MRLNKRAVVKPSLAVCVLIRVFKDTAQRSNGGKEDTKSTEDVANVEPTGDADARHDHVRT